MNTDEQILQSIITMFNKGIDIQRIMKSLPSDFCKKTERKSIVYSTIYLHMMKQKGKC